MTALVLHGASDVTITLDDSAVAGREAAIAKAVRVAEVASPAEAQRAVDAIRDLKAIVKAVEESRGEIKRPVLDLGRRIDSVAREFIEPVDVEVRRLQGLISSYQEGVESARREAERARAEAMRKAEAEAARAQAEIAKAKRMAELEAAAQAAKAQVESDPFAEAEAEAARVKAAQEAAARISDMMKAKSDAMKAATAATSAAITPRQPEGMRVQRTPEFEVTDPMAFAVARPDLVEITPKRAAILAEMRKLAEWDGRAPIAPGAIGWWVGKVVVR